jgi:T5orf172 domain
VEQVLQKGSSGGEELKRKESKPTRAELIATFLAEMEREKPSPLCVYLFHAVGLDIYKIGVSSTENAKARMKDLADVMPFDLELIAVSKLGTWRSAFDYEKALHKQYAKHRVKGEWFRLSESDAEAVRNSIVDLDRIRSEAATPLHERTT